MDSHHAHAIVTRCVDAHVQTIARALDSATHCLVFPNVVLHQKCTMRHYKERIRNPRRAKKHCACEVKRMACLLYTSDAADDTPC
eukprot:584375-Pyramimonas_sp.AAC.1